MRGDIPTLEVQRHCNVVMTVAIALIVVGLLWLLQAIWGDLVADLIILAVVWMSLIALRESEAKHARRP